MAEFIGTRARKHKPLPRAGHGMFPDVIFLPRYRIDALPTAQEAGSPDRIPGVHIPAASDQPIANDYLGYPFPWLFAMHGEVRFPPDAQTLSRVRCWESLDEQGLQVIRVVLLDDPDDTENRSSGFFGNLLDLRPARDAGAGRRRARGRPKEIQQMAYWLMKSEPGEWSWDDQVKENPAEWDGVRNHQASNNMKAMKIGDKAFFYHSGKDREIVGVVRIVKEYYPDHTDPTGKFGMVDVEAVEPLKTPVSITDIKARPEFSEFQLVRNSRLSVMPVQPGHWKRICKMGGIDP